MKLFFFAQAICASTLVTWASTSTAAAAPAPARTVDVTLLYPAPVGTVFDRTCGDFLRAEVDQELVAETVARRAEFQGLMDREGAELMRVVLAEVDVPFPYAQMQATLTVCPLSTTSMPLLINVRPWLSGAKEPAPASFFPVVVFHELMHHYISGVRGSPLWRKYAKEPPVTLVHLHVMALEKFALTKLDRKADLAHLDRLYRTDPAPSFYKRAWEIVEQEGHEAFVAELKTMAGPTPRP